MLYAWITVLVGRWDKDRAGTLTGYTDLTFFSINSFHGTMHYDASQERLIEKMARSDKNVQQSE